MHWLHRTMTLAFLSIVLTQASAADLSVSKTASADLAKVGENLTYTITVINNGAMAAIGVTVTDPLPVGMTPVSVMSSQGICFMVEEPIPLSTERGNVSGNAVAILVACDLGDLASDASATVAIVVTPSAAGAICNTANVTSVQTEIDAATTCVSVVAAGECDNLEQLISQVQVLFLGHGRTKSLAQKLRAAQRSIARENSVAAINKLNAFINQVEALKRSGRMDDAPADSLIGCAQAIRSQLEESL